MRWLLFALVFLFGAFMIFYAIHRNQKSDFIARGESIAIIPFENIDTDDQCTNHKAKLALILCCGSTTN
jgi:hypothetical protein